MYNKNDRSAIIIILLLCCGNWLQLFKLYEEEMKDVVSLVEQAEVTDARVTDYLRGLKSMSEVYSKVSIRPVKVTKFLNFVFSARMINCVDYGTGCPLLYSLGLLSDQSDHSIYILF